MTEKPVMAEHRELRQEKMRYVKEKGINPFGARFSVSSLVGDIKDGYEEGRGVSVAGRLTAARRHGKSIFCDLKDSTGKIQLYLNTDTAEQETRELFQHGIDVGDIVGATGSLFTTRTGEVTVKVERITLLSKSLRALPEKWHGLKDTETRYRQRYLDLIANDRTKEIFKTRSLIVRYIRSFLDARGYLEVETPMMHPIAGGASGNPFKTHHETLDMDLYLRIAPELYLKRLLVGGFERVYEINRSFRNEGISTRHNPEFTMLEVYTAYGDCAQTMELTRELITDTVRRVRGKTTIEYQGRSLDFSRWETVSFAAIMKETYDINPDDEVAEWTRKLSAGGVELEHGAVGRTQVANIIADLLTPRSDHPVFVVDLFADLCPLAKVKDDNPLLSDRFELFIGGMEVANAYSELNDPLEQRRRFEAQDAASVDEEFVKALEYGMPPAGGLGIGIDRLVMIMTNAPSIREVILFPQLRR